MSSSCEPGTIADLAGAAGSRRASAVSIAFVALPFWFPVGGMLADVLAERSRLTVGFAERAVFIAPLVSLVALMGLDQFALAHLTLLSGVG
jgi:hypothetical protein